VHSPDDHIEDAEIIPEPVTPTPRPAASAAPSASRPGPLDVVRRTARFGAGVTLLAGDGVRRLLAQPDQQDPATRRALAPAPAAPTPTRRVGAMVAAAGRAVTSLPPVAWARARAEREGQASRKYAKSVLGEAAGAATDLAVEQTKKIDFDRISRDFELSRIVLQSTGGLTGAAIDAVRAQAVGVDSVIDRVITKVLRREVERPPFRLDE
jgi:hypothetical protein